MKKRIKSYFLTGLLVMSPLFISGYVLYIMFRFIDGILGSLVNIFVKRTLGFAIPGLGLIFFLLIILFTGIISAHFFGKSLQRFLDRIANNFPLLRNIYPSVRQAIEMLFSDNSLSTRKIVLCEYPSKGIWAIGFVMSEDWNEIQLKSGQALVNVYIPSVPNPATGFLFFLPRQNLIPLDIGFPDAMRLIVSGGLLSPPVHSENLKG